MIDELTQGANGAQQELQRSTAKLAEMEEFLGADAAHRQRAPVKIDGEQELRCSHVHDEEFESRVEKDYGIIVRIQGDNGNCLLLCGGIHMFGTQGALEVAISESFIRQVQQSRAKEFVQVVEVPVLKDGGSINREGLRWKELPFRPLT